MDSSTALQDQIVANLKKHQDGLSTSNLLGLLCVEPGALNQQLAALVGKKVIIAKKANGREVYVLALLAAAAV